MLAKYRIFLVFLTALFFSACDFAGKTGSETRNNMSEAEIAKFQQLEIKPGAPSTALSATAAADAASNGREAPIPLSELCPTARIAGEISITGEMKADLDNLKGEYQGQPLTKEMLPLIMQQEEYFKIVDGREPVNHVVQFCVPTNENKAIGSIRYGKWFPLRASWITDEAYHFEFDRKGMRSENLSNFIQSLTIQGQPIIPKNEVFTEYRRIDLGTIAVSSSFPKKVESTLLATDPESSINKWAEHGVRIWGPVNQLKINKLAKGTPEKPLTLTASFLSDTPAGVEVDQPPASAPITVQNPPSPSPTTNSPSGVVSKKPDHASPVTHPLDKQKNHAEKEKNVKPPKKEEAVLPKKPVRKTNSPVNVSLAPSSRIHPNSKEEREFDLSRFKQSPMSLETAKAKCRGGDQVQFSLLMKARLKLIDEWKQEDYRDRMVDVIKKDLETQFDNDLKKDLQANQSDGLGKLVDEAKLRTWYSGLTIGYAKTITRSMNKFNDPPVPVVPASVFLYLLGDKNCILYNPSGDGIQEKAPPGNLKDIFANSYLPKAGWYLFTENDSSIRLIRDPNTQQITQVDFSSVFTLPVPRSLLTRILNMGETIDLGITSIPAIKLLKEAIRDDMLNNYFTVRGTAKFKYIDRTMVHVTLDRLTNPSASFDIRPIFVNQPVARGMPIEGLFTNASSTSQVNVGFVESVPVVASK